MVGRYRKRTIARWLSCLRSCQILKDATPAVRATMTIGEISAEDAAEQLALFDELLKQLPEEIKTAIHAHYFEEEVQTYTDRQNANEGKKRIIEELTRRYRLGTIIFREAKFNRPYFLRK